MKEKVATWVLLRGLTREHRHWETFPETLQQYFPEAKIISPDLPGNGDHADVKSPASIRDMMLYLRKEIASAMTGGPVHIIGLSMGAMVAIEWMRSYPEECAAGVFINTSLKGISPFYHRLRPENYHRILNSLLTTDNVRREKTILEVTSNLYPETRPLLRRWISYAEKNTVQRRNAIRQLIAASRYRAPGKKPDVPMLLLRSDNDKLVNSRSSMALAEKWSLPIETHPLAGHDLPLDDADWVCEKIKAWLVKE